jgi:hypothetical protein
MLQNSDSAHDATRRRAIAAVLALLGVLLASSVIWQASNAAFTATTTNGVNSFSTGTVAITDNDSGTALFSVTALKPGSTGTACIRVTYSGSLAAAVKLYTAASPAAAATNSLDTYITLQVEEGAFSVQPAYPACTTFTANPVTPIYNGLLSNFTSTETSYATGSGTWAPSGSATKDYRFTYTLSNSAPNSVTNSSASLTFEWEADNT